SESSPQGPRPITNFDSIAAINRGAHQERETLTVPLLGIGSPSYARTMIRKDVLSAICTFLLSVCSAAQNPVAEPRVRAPELGLKVGVLPAGRPPGVTRAGGAGGGGGARLPGESKQRGGTATRAHLGKLYRSS